LLKEGIQVLGGFGLEAFLVIVQSQFLFRALLEQAPEPVEEPFIAGFTSSGIDCQLLIENNPRGALP